MMERGAKDSMQMEERLAFKTESEVLRKEIRKATVSDVSLLYHLCSRFRFLR